LIIDFSHFNGYFIADFDHILDLINSVISKLADMNHAFFARQHFYKSAEIHNNGLLSVYITPTSTSPYQAAIISIAFWRMPRRRAYYSNAVVIDIDVSLAFLLRWNDGLASRTDDSSDLCRRYGTLYMRGAYG
jgi:hypothetical protein